MYSPEKVRNGIYSLKTGASKDKNLILIHGLSGDGSFNKPDNQMKRLYERLEDDGDLTDYNVWALTYNSWWVPFMNSGQWLTEEIKKIEGYNFSQAIVVGYSMGGLIARTMITFGFDFKYLVTIDTPHHGPVTALNWSLWGITLSEFLFGIKSLAWGSPSQQLIDLSPLDKAKRANNYAFYAVDFRNNSKDKYHGNDWVVSTHSQLAMDLGEDICWRMIWNKDYEDNNDVTNIGQPHTSASYPENCEDAIQLIKKLLKGEPMPKRKLNDKTDSSNIQHYEDTIPTLPFIISEPHIWYYYANDGLPYVKFKGKIENTGTKPIKIPLNEIVRSNLGRFYSRDENSTEIGLTPKSKRDLLLKRNQTNKDLQQEEAEVFLNGKIEKIPVHYLPLPISETSVLPTESIWTLEITNLKATATVDEGGTDVLLEGVIKNPTPVTFELHNWSINSYINTDTENGNLGVNGDVFSWIAEHRFLTIMPNAETPFKLDCDFSTQQKPSTIRLIIGSKEMPAFDEVIPVN